MEGSLLVALSQNGCGAGNISNTFLECKPVLLNVWFHLICVNVLKHWSNNQVVLPWWLIVGTKHSPRLLRRCWRKGEGTRELLQSPPEHPPGSAKKWKWNKSRQLCQPHLRLPFHGALICACILLNLVIPACIYSLSIICLEMQLPLISSWEPGHKFNMIAYFSLLDASSYPLNIPCWITAKSFCMSCPISRIHPHGWFQPRAVEMRLKSNWNAVEI